MYCMRPRIDSPRPARFALRRRASTTHLTSLSPPPPRVRSLREAVRDIVHQAALSGRSYAEVAQLAASAMVSYTEDASWVAIAARTAVMHLRSVKGTATTLTVPCLGCELPPPPREGSPGADAAPTPPSRRAFTVVIFRAIADDPLVAAPAPGAADARLELPKGSKDAIHVVVSTLDDATTTAALVAAAETRLATGLNDAADTAFCSALKTRLTALFGSSWGIVLSPLPTDETAGGLHTPAAALPPAARRRCLEAAIVGRAAPASATTAAAAAASDGNGAAPAPPPASSSQQPNKRYRLVVFQLPPGEALDVLPGAASSGSSASSSSGWREAVRYVRHNGWTLSRMALYTVAGGCLIAYLAWNYATDNRCARPGHIKSAMSPTLDLSAGGGSLAGGATRMSTALFRAVFGGSSAAAAGGAPAAAVSVDPAGAAFAVDDFGQPLPNDTVTGAAATAPWEAAAAADSDALPAGCTLALAEEAEWRINASPVLFYGGLAAIVLLSLLRMLQNAIRRTRMRALLKGMTSVAAAVTAAGGGARGGGGGAGDAGSKKRR